MMKTKRASSASIICSRRTFVFLAKLAILPIVVVILVIFGRQLYKKISDTAANNEESSRILVQHEIPTHVEPNEALVDVVEVAESPVTISELDEILKDFPDQDDIRILNYIRRKHLVPPSKAGYALHNPEFENPSVGQAQRVMKILKNMKNGFFIECGAFDGERLSNTLVFERYYGWEGILIEASAKNFEMLLKKRRKAWASDVCLSLTQYPEKIYFKEDGTVGFIVDSSKATAKNVVSMQCFPLYSILKAINRTEVDYFSLDVEGAELAVLKAIPFDKITFKVLTVETDHIKEGGSKAVVDFMKTKGYTSVGRVTHAYAGDTVFVNNNILTDEMYIK